MVKNSIYLVKWKRTLSSVIILFFLTTALAGINVAWASPTKVYVDPTLTLDPSYAPGTAFSIAITVDYVEEIWGYQIEMTYNPEVLQGVSIDDASFLGSAGGDVQTAPGMGFDNVNGKLNLFAAFLFPKENFPTGGGPLALISFEVIGTGSSPLNFGLNTGLANKTGGWKLGPDWEPILYGANPDAFTNGYFDNRFTPADISADLVRRSAWPEHHHYVISKDEDDYQTLNAKVKNLGVIEVYVKVTFEVSKDGADPTTYETATEFMAPGEMRNLFYNLPMTTGNEGKYKVTARCQYSPDGDYWFLGEKTKTFGFAVVP